MPIFYTDTGSLNRLEVTGSTAMSGSSNVLHIKGSGSAILTISGSTGGLMEISDLAPGLGMFTITSASIDVFSIGRSQNVNISGSLRVSQGITGSLFGTASFATSASNALTASYVANASSFPFTLSAVISGSLIVTGSTAVSGGLSITSGSVILGNYTNFSNSNLVIDKTSNRIYTSYDATNIEYRWSGFEIDHVNKLTQFGYTDQNVFQSATIRMERDAFDSSVISTNLQDGFIGGGAIGLRLEYRVGAVSKYTLGDYVGVGNATILEVDDAAQVVSISKSTNVTGSLRVTEAVGARRTFLTASEALTAGDFVNVAVGGVRRATNNDTNKQAHGFVAQGASTGNAVTVFYSGLNTGVTGLAAGSRYFLGTAGGETTTPPTAVGQLSQEVGVAVASTAILVNFGPAIIT